MPCHPFVVLVAKSKPGERTVRIDMPDANHKMVCGAVTSVGSTTVLGSFPESSTAWVAVHDPARTNAHVVLRVLALVDEGTQTYETTVKRLQFNLLTADDEAAVAKCAWGDADPRGLLEFSSRPNNNSNNNKNNTCVLTCPIPSKYTLCGGGFYSSVPIISSQPVGSSAYQRVLYNGGRRAVEAFGGGGWAVHSPSDDHLTVFAVGLRVKKSAGVDTHISVSLEEGCWRAKLPHPQNEVVVQLGCSASQDAAAAALFLAPSEASKIAISRAPPSVWAQYHTPYRSIADKDTNRQYTRSTIERY